MMELRHEIRIHVCVVNDHRLGLLLANRVRDRRHIGVAQEQCPVFQGKRSQQERLARPRISEDNRILIEIAQELEFGLAANDTVPENRAPRDRIHAQSRVSPRYPQETDAPG